jgi:hypothetical protein
MTSKPKSTTWSCGMIGTSLTSNTCHYVRPNVVDGVFPIINMTGEALSSVAIVQNAIKVLSANTSKITSEQALFARYLVHIVGDIHQPLHSVSLFNETYPSGDRGGNSQKIIILNGSS